MQALELNALLQIEEEQKDRKRSSRRQYYHEGNVGAPDDLERNVELAKHELSVVQSKKKHMHHNQSASFTQQTSRDLKALQYNKRKQQNANEVESADYNSQLQQAATIRGTALSERIKKGGVEEDSKQSFVISQTSGFQYSDEAMALRQSKNS